MFTEWGERSENVPMFRCFSYKWGGMTRDGYTAMMVWLSPHQQCVCADYFALGKARVAVTYDLYDVGTLMYYEARGCYCLWCDYSCGIFALRRECGSLIGYVLLMHGEVILFFNVFSLPLDWRNVLDDAVYVDAGFNNTENENIFVPSAAIYTPGTPLSAANAT